MKRLAPLAAFAVLAAASAARAQDTPEPQALDPFAQAMAAQKVADFRADLNAHIREEEDKIFPKIHAGLDEAKNKALTAAANREGFKLA